MKEINDKIREEIKKREEFYETSLEQVEKDIWITIEIENSPSLSFSFWNNKLIGTFDGYNMNINANIHSTQLFRETEMTIGQFSSPIGRAFAIGKMFDKTRFILYASGSIENFKSGDYMFIRFTQTDRDEDVDVNISILEGGIHVFKQNFNFPWRVKPYAIQLSW